MISMSEPISDTASARCRATRATPVAGILRGAFFHYIRVLGNGWQVVRQVGAALAARPEERVLDVGCGTGAFCLVVPGEYVGVDTNPNYIAFGRWRWAGAGRCFQATDFAAFDDVASFDKALLVNCLHHMSDAEASAALLKLARLVRRCLVVADADPEASNWLQAFLLRHDRGHFIRSRAAQRALLNGHFTVTGEWQFRNTPHTVVQTLFVCEPK